ncbi:MAG TPA: hypothetical protein VFB38_12905 [Chthonomonadaceae bacterium]|nr:hypothetical protein [Chthonomonadaceae bacterium]
MSSNDTVVLYRPVGQKELELIQESGYRAFPPRLFWQPFFYPVLNEEYATQIARDWNTKDKASGYVGYMTRFRVKTDFLSRYSVQTVGGAQHKEYGIPAADLEEFNQNIVGRSKLLPSSGQTKQSQNERPARGQTWRQNSGKIEGSFFMPRL